MSNADDLVDRQLRARRTVLPLASGGVGFMLDGAEPPPPIKPNESVRLSSIPAATYVPFIPEKLLVSGRTRHDWVFTDLLIDGASQLERPVASKDLADGETLNANPASGAKVLLLKGVAALTKELVLIVTYVGENRDGEHFQCAIIGEVLKNAA